MLYARYRSNLVWLALATITPFAAAQAETKVQFNRDVLPILSANCFQCHGPDAAERKRDIRFDTQEGLFAKTKGGHDLVVPGNPDASEVFKRMIDPDPDHRMPPAEAKLNVTDNEIQTIKKWIEQGAQWQGHWAFIAPEKPDLPQVSDTEWCRNDIDRFILARLEKAGLKPSPETDKETLIRRVSLDLTGLPPTPAEVDAFLADTSENAYEKVVDRLLASPHYGERMSFVWLDAARYSDTHGYQRDTMRIMWPWRDWVIKAFNDNMPYDQFTIEQLAGDLLPNPTLEQRIATGFNRNHRINGEGGIIPEEYAVEYVADRVSTTSTVFMGLSMECARCHDHKFDPFTQKEFYELAAFFNQVPEEGKGRETGNDVPVIEVPSPEQDQKKAELTARLSALEQELSGPDVRLDAMQASWESQLRSKFAALAWKPVDNAQVTSKNGTVLTPQADHSLLASGPVPDQEVFSVTFAAAGPVGSIRLDVLTDPSLPKSGPGRAHNGNVVLSGFEVERVRPGADTAAIPVAQAMADYAQPNGDFGVQFAVDGNPETGWGTGSFAKRENRTAVFILDPAADIAAGDRVTVRLKHESPYIMHAMGRFRLSYSSSRELAQWTKHELGPWHYVGPIKADEPNVNKLLGLALPPEEGFDPARTYGDGSQRWVEKPEWADGQVVKFESRDQGVHYLYRTIRIQAPTTLTLTLGSNDAIKVWIDGQEKLANNVGRTAAPDQERLSVFIEEGTHELLVKVVNYGGEAAYYFRMVEDDGQALLAMMNVLETPAEQRSPESRMQLQTLFRERDPQWLAKKAETATVRSELDVLKKSIITTMVMEDMPTPRDTYKLIRGVYNKPDTSEKLYPSVPASLGEMDESLPRNRLGFAKWLMDPKHPLTARVRVNHFWQSYFGRGLVKTSEDFGTQGTPPTHQDLLDWLAVDFIESGWDIKAMQKKIVMSATYRQSSRVAQDHLDKDPANLMLARAPRTRLPAETIRDQALAASGLLNPAIGGPSVKPYQPGDLWSALTFQNMDEYDTNFYVQDTGDKLYRRGLYIYWKRTIMPPHMQIFDVLGREKCSMRRETTNTPMQALAVMNDPTFVEAARALAQRMIHEGGGRSVDRVRYGYKLLLSEMPSQRKEQILLAALNDYQSHFIREQQAAGELLGVGDSEPDAAIPQPELAAYTMLASVMLNMDEAITRE